MGKEAPRPSGPRSALQEPGRGAVGAGGQSGSDSLRGSAGGERGTPAAPRNRWLPKTDSGGGAEGLTAMASVRGARELGAPGDSPATPGVPTPDGFPSAGRGAEADFAATAGFAAGTRHPHPRRGGFSKRLRSQDGPGAQGGPRFEPSVGPALELGVSAVHKGQGTEPGLPGTAEVTGSALSSPRGPTEKRGSALGPQGVPPLCSAAGAIGPREDGAGHQSRARGGAGWPQDGVHYSLSLGRQLPSSCMWPALCRTQKTQWGPL